MAHREEPTVLTRRPALPQRPRALEHSPYDAPRSLRVTEATWRRLQRRATGDGLTTSFVLAVLARDYANFDLDAPPVTKGGGPTRSARISEGVWEGLKTRALAEGLPATRVLMALAEDYAEGLIDLHVHIVTSQKQHATEPTA
jgi:hypothetical protein